MTAVSRGHVCLAFCSFGRVSRALMVITWMSLHYGVGVNCKNGAGVMYKG